jgi:hypothetical protein
MCAGQTRSAGEANGEPVKIERNMKNVLLGKKIL